MQQKVGFCDKVMLSLSSSVRPVLLPVFDYGDSWMPDFMHMEAVSVTEIAVVLFNIHHFTQHNKQSRSLPLMECVCGTKIIGKILKRSVVPED